MNKFDKVWEEHFMLLQEFYKENQKLPSKKTVYKNFNLGSWLSNQKKFLKREKLPVYRKQLLDSQFPDWLKPDRMKEKKKELWNAYCEAEDEGTPIDEFLQGDEFYEALKRGIYTCEAWIKDIGHIHSIKLMNTVAECYAIIYPYISAKYLTLLMDVYGCKEYEDVSDMIETLPFEDVAAMEDRIELMLETCTEREKEIIRYRYGLETGSSMTYEEIGNIYGRCNERVREIIAKAMRKLRHPSRRNLLYDAGELNYLNLPQKEIAELYRKGYKSTTSVIHKLHVLDSVSIADIRKKLHIVEVGKDEFEPLVKNVYWLNDIPLINCKFSTRTFNCLWRSGIRTLSELKQKSKEELLNIRNLGQGSLKEIEEYLHGLGNDFAETNDSKELSEELWEKIDFCKECPQAILHMNGRYIPLQKATEL